MLRSLDWCAVAINVPVVRYVRQYQDHEVASFVKEDSSMGFYLVQVDKKGKVMGRWGGI